MDLHKQGAFEHFFANTQKPRVVLQWNRRGYVNRSGEQRSQLGAVSGVLEGKLSLVNSSLVACESVHLYRRQRAISGLP